jgi:DNA-directed RNA polymerase subunit RPC12/RpoP
MNFDTRADFTTHFSATHSFKCDLCSTTFDTLANKEDHTRASHICAKCQAIFGNQESLKVHVAQAHVFLCEKGQQHFDSTAQLAEHYTATHIFKCLSCNEEFETATARTKHRHAQHELKCPDCQGTFDTSSALLKHGKSHWYHCEKCSAAFETKLALSEHNTSGHSLKCSKCVQVFESIASLVDHASIHAQGGLIKSELCPAFFKTSNAHTDHTKEHESTSTPTKKNGLKYSCPNCEKEYTSVIDLTGHIMHAHFLQCKQCPGLRFASLQELSEHTAAKHMPVPVVSTATQTEPTKDIVLAKSLGIDTYNSYSSDESFQSAHSSQQTPIAQVYTLPVYETKEVQTTKYRCGNCVGAFDTEEDLALHIDNSPFHGTPDLSCTECHIDPFQNQIELLKHIESKLHKTQWILCVV